MVKKMQKVGVEHLWSVLCRRSVLDAETNNISLMDVVERFQFQLPSAAIRAAESDETKGFMFPVELEVVSNFKKLITNETVIFDFRLRFLNSQGGQTNVSNSSRVAIDKNLKNIRVRAKVGTFAIDKHAKSGEYTIIVEVKDVTSDVFSEAARIPLEVELNEANKG